MALICLYFKSIAITILMTTRIKSKAGKKAGHTADSKVRLAPVSDFPNELQPMLATLIDAPFDTDG
jgi:hypothetical protein